MVTPTIQRRQPPLDTDRGCNAVTVPRPQCGWRYCRYIIFRIFRLPAKHLLMFTHNSPRCETDIFSVLLEAATLRAKLANEAYTAHKATILELELRAKYYKKMWRAMVKEKEQADVAAELDIVKVSEKEPTQTFTTVKRKQKQSEMTIWRQELEDLREVSTPKKKTTEKGTRSGHEPEAVVTEFQQSLSEGLPSAASGGKVRWSAKQNIRPALTAHKIGLYRKTQKGKVGRVRELPRASRHLRAVGTLFG